MCLKMAIRYYLNSSKWIPTKEDIDLAFRCVQVEEKERISKFVYKKDFKMALLAQLLLRKCVSEQLGKSYEKLKFVRTEKGKPIVLDPSLHKVKFDFNLSHHGHYCVLAADARDKVGVDVMKTEYTGGKPLEDFFHLMRRQFSSSEWNFIRYSGDTSSDKAKIGRFMRLWCLKESYVKAEGIGIAFDLQRISFRCPTTVITTNLVVNDTEVTVDGKVLPKWTFEESLIDEDHCVAVAYELDKEIDTDDAGRLVKPTPLPFTELTFDKLVQNAVPFLATDSTSWDTYSTRQ